MKLTDLYNRIAGYSPLLEISLRKLFWNNISALSKYRSKNNGSGLDSSPINFDRILENLRDRGVEKGSIIIVHSSYDILERTGLSPEEINSKLIEFVGSNGTLVMPCIRKFKEEGKPVDSLKKNLDDIVCTYDVQKSKVVSGLLPYLLMQRADSFVSRFPLNPVVAVGKHAKAMVENNLEGNDNSPHGPNSSWKYCVDNNAVVIGLGVDMPHFLTVTHVNEECRTDWPILDWYRKRKFKVIDRDFKTEIVVLERRPVWGAIYLAENKYRKDLISAKILNIAIVEGLNISIIDTKTLINFLMNHQYKSYPYYVESKFIKKGRDMKL